MNIRILLLVRKGERLLRPETPLYSVYLIGGVANLSFGAAVLYKISKDTVYGTLPRWRWISSFTDLVAYKEIGNFLSNFYFIAGVVIGLSLIFLLLFNYYEYWYVDFLLHIGNIGLFLYLTPKPLADFKFTTNFIKTHNITVAKPYSLIESTLHNHLFAGIIVGAVASSVIYFYYKYNINKIY